MHREWEPEKLVAGWTLVEHDHRELVVDKDKRGATRLGFVLMLKFFEQEGRFPRSAGELPPAAISYVARQVGADQGELAEYNWAGRTAERHRAQIRDALGFRRFAKEDEPKIAGWLADEVAAVELSDERLRDALLAHCRNERIEPPSRVGRILGAARAAVTERFTASVSSRLSAEPRGALEALAGIGATGPDPVSGAWLAELKADPGRVSRETLSVEINKLTRVRRLGLPVGLFDGWSDKLVAAWRARAAAEYQSDLRDHSQPVRHTLLAALAWVRQTEIVDGLVDLLIALVHKIGARAERAAEQELLADLRRVRGKEGMLFRLAEAALEHPDEKVRDALYPIVAPATLADLVREGHATESALRQRTRVRLRASYSAHYRAVLPALLQALEFRSSTSSAHAPIIEAIRLLRLYADRPRVRFYGTEEVVPLDGVVPAEWRAAVVEERPDGTKRVERIPYELCVLAELREAIRRREVWVVGAVRWRDPDSDLPSDFDAHRVSHYERLRRPLDPTAFIAGVQGELSKALLDLNKAQAAGETGGVRFGLRAGKPWITVPKLARQPEPQNLDLLKAAVQDRWGTVDLLDILVEADHRVGLVDCFPSIASRQSMPADFLRERLLLVLFALGTNTGLKCVAGEEHGHGEAALRHVRRLHITRENLRRAIARIVNATFAVRDQSLWGTGTSCASDSKKFGSWESNLMTEYHVRYRGPGVMIYWHVERGRLCVYSQLKECSSSEVAAMITGLAHHGTDVPVEANYTDTHGASVVGFAFTYLLSYSLLPRLKNIGASRLYLPSPELAGQLPELSSVLTRPIRWDVIAQQYDQMVKYATALRLRTVEAEQLLRRFSRRGPQHPTLAAIVELGRAVKSIFVARYLRIEALRQEINDGLQVVENWNSANTVVFYGKDSDLTGPDRETQEISVLSLHLLQSALVYVNTLLLQRILADQPIQLTAEDRRAITPLFWSHVRPYGNFQLHMDQHLDLEPRPQAV